MFSRTYCAKLFQGDVGNSQGLGTNQYSRLMAFIINCGLFEVHSLPNKCLSQMATETKILDDKNYNTT